MGQAGSDSARPIQKEADGTPDRATWADGFGIKYAGPLEDTPLWCYLMEKKKPTYDLGSIQSSAGSTMGITNSAIRSAAEMGMTRDDMIDVIKGLTRRDFYKSMTTYQNHRVWMDVYHGRADGYEIYIKFVQDTVAEFTCTSFKEG